MAVTLGTVKVHGRVLVQLDGHDPVEVGTVEVDVPVTVGALPTATTDHDHKPVQHRDGREPWCNYCGKAQHGTEPQSRLPQG